MQEVWIVVVWYNLDKEEVKRLEKKLVSNSSALIQIGFIKK